MRCFDLGILRREDVGWAVADLSLNEGWIARKVRERCILYIILGGCDNKPSLLAIACLSDTKEMK